MTKDTIIYDPRSWDGIFCREIALRVLGGTDNCQVIDWAPGGPDVIFPSEGFVYVLGLPLDAPFGSTVPYDCETTWPRLTWIHNHPDAIRNTDEGTPGLRIAGVANCRLAYAHFFSQRDSRPTREDFLFARVREPECLKLVQAKTGGFEGFVSAFFLGLSRLSQQVYWGLLLSEDAAISRPYIQELAQLGRTVFDTRVHQGEPAVQPTPGCPVVMDTWPLKDGLAKLQGCGQGVCSICGSSTSPLTQVEYAGKPTWVCLGSCKPKENADELVCEQGHKIKCSLLYAELVQWLDQQHITSDSIGSIRRRVLLPWATEWNEIVRQETKAREQKT
jgi:hypothetical protein